MPILSICLREREREREGGRERETETQRETDRQTDRQAGWQTGRQLQSQTDRQRERECVCVGGGRGGESKNTENPRCCIQKCSHHQVPVRSLLSKSGFKVTKTAV